MNPELKKLLEQIEDIDEEIHQLRQEQDRFGSNSPKWQELDQKRFDLMQYRRELIQQQDKYL